MMDTLRRLLFAATALSTVACGPTEAGDSSTDTGPIRYDDRMSVWVEFMPLVDVSEHVGFAATHELNLNVAVHRSALNEVDLKTLCDRASEQKVAIRLWPLLPEEDGYWANQSNVDEFLAYLEEVRALADYTCPRYDGIVFDMEMSKGRVDELLELIGDEQNSVPDIVNFFIDGIDPEQFEGARDKYSSAVDSLHDDGRIAIGTTWPWLADDYTGDDDESLAMGSWAPMAGIDWDIVSYQVYRSQFEGRYGALLGNDVAFTPHLVQSYAHTAVDLHGERAGIDLGTVGNPGVVSSGGYDDPDDLRDDIAAALSAGISPGRIAIFSLDGMLEVGEEEEWTEVPEGREFEQSAATGNIRQTFEFLDATHTP